MAYWDPHIHVQSHTGCLGPTYLCNNLTWPFAFQCVAFVFPDGINSEKKRVMIRVWRGRPLCSWGVKFRNNQYLTVHQHQDARNNGSVRHMPNKKLPSKHIETFLVRRLRLPSPYFARGYNQIAAHIEFFSYTSDGHG